MRENDELLKKMIFEIDNCIVQKINKKSDPETFQFIFDPVLTTNLSGGIATLLIRAILNKLTIDEHRIFRWRLEHKYWQYEILNHYIPGCMAETISVSKLLDKEDGILQVRNLCKKGFFIKATLGDSSGRENTFDRTNELDNIINAHQTEPDKQEKWVLQKRLNLKHEFRIHTFCRDLINGLTFRIEGQYLPKNYEAEEFVKRILKQLPDTILQGTLIGWDIGITDNDQYYVIEANFTGFHPVFYPGFQTSGYFSDPNFGPIICAWLNNYFRINYHISISSVANIIYENYEFYRDFIYYDAIFTREHHEILRKKAKNHPVWGLIYFAEEINKQMLDLLEYMEIQHFCEKYYLIVKEEYFLSTVFMVAKHSLVYIFTEDSLFTKEENIKIKSFETQKRKQFCYEKVISKTDIKSCFII